LWPCLRARSSPRRVPPLLTGAATKAGKRCATRRRTRYDFLRRSSSMRTGLERRGQKRMGERKAAKSWPTGARRRPRFLFIAAEWQPRQPWRANSSAEFPKPAPSLTCRQPSNFCGRSPASIKSVSRRRAGASTGISPPIPKRSKNQRSDSWTVRRPGSRHHAR
jgi:hypothetical protein